MDRAPHLVAEDDDPLFSALFIHLRSRHRAREVIKDLRSRGFVVIAENELRALRSAAGKPVSDTTAAGFSAAVLAATKNFG